MNHSTIELRWFHFFASWTLCILTGIALQLIFSTYVMGIEEAIGFSLLTALIALGVSSPFIILFCLVVHYTILNKPRSVVEIHRRVLLWHVAGSILVFVGLVVFFNHEMKAGAGYVLLIMLGYFTIDSIYFHSLIAKKTKIKSQSHFENNELIDSF